jgi:hypothetical protein
MRRIGILLLLACSAAAADIVVMRDGTVHEGKVTRKDGAVIVTGADGSRVELPESDIRRISTLDPVAASGPAIVPAATSASAPASPGEAMGAISVEKIDRPEALAFLAMRSMSAAGPGAAADYRRQLQQFQSMVHDRKRKVSGEWLAPGDFQRRRANYENWLKEAVEISRKVKVNATAADKTAAQNSATAKLRQTAALWYDPPIRTALLGMQAVQAGDFRTADALFRDAAEEWPTIGAMLQGAALARMQVGQPLSASTYVQQLLRLYPDSRDVYELGVSVLRATPGGDIRDPAFVALDGLIKEFEKPQTAAPSGTAINWLMPGRQPWTVRDKTSLPVPPYDRLSMVQCLGVPVGKQTLLVDSAALDGAEEIWVRLDSSTYVPARARRLTVSGTGIAPPFALLTVPAAQFEPLTFDRKAVFAEKSTITLYASDLLPQMSQRVRKAGGQIISAGADGKYVLNVAIAAGETAAPVFADDGRLVCMLAGKTDALADGGGPGGMYTQADIAPLIERAGGDYGGYSSYYGAKLKRTPTVTAAKGNVFVVSITASEIFKN